MFKSDKPKTYRDVDLALACVREDFGYYGPVTLITELTADTGAAEGPEPKA